MWNLPVFCGEKRFRFLASRPSEGDENAPLVAWCVVELFARESGRNSPRELKAVSFPERICFEREPEPRYSSSCNFQYIYIAWTGCLLKPSKTDPRFILLLFQILHLLSTILEKMMRNESFGSVSLTLSIKKLSNFHGLGQCRTARPRAT